MNYALSSMSNSTCSLPVVTWLSHQLSCVAWFEFQEPFRSSRTCGHSTCFILTSPHYVSVVSSQITTRRVTPVQYWDRERGRSHNLCHSTCSNYSILLLVLTSYCANLYIQLHHRYTYIRTVVYNGSGTGCSFRYLLESGSMCHG